MEKKIRITECQLRKIVNESVKGVLSELDWKTYINAARKRKAQGDDFRSKIGIPFMRSGYDDKADKLAKHAEKAFNRKHGKNGKDYNYEGDSYDYQGRSKNFHTKDDWDFDIKNPVSSRWKDDEDGKEVVVRRYRHGKGVPHRDSGMVHDDTFDFEEHPTNYSGYTHRWHTFKYDKDGEHYDPYNSSVGNEISQSKDEDYNDRQSKMSSDMENYYTGKSKYTKGKGWDD